jgi:hypothetical protein
MYEYYSSKITTITLLYNIITLYDLFIIIIIILIIHTTTTRNNNKIIFY